MTDDDEPTEYETLEERDTEFEKGDVPPNRGGCWFCHDDSGSMSFSLEFDTFYHDRCAAIADVADADDPVLAYERNRRADDDG